MVFQGYLGAFDAVGVFGEEAGGFEVWLFFVRGCAAVFCGGEGRVVQAAEGYFL